MKILKKFFSVFMVAMLLFVNATFAQISPVSPQYWQADGSDVLSPISPFTFPGGGGGAVDSVNGETGVVVLDQDDILDGVTNKQFSATEQTKLSNAIVNNNATAVTLDDDLTIGGDLTVNGTTTTLDTTTLDVEAKVITNANVETPTDTTANAAGWTIKGLTDKVIQWLDVDDLFHFNQGIRIDNANGLTFNDGTTQTTAGGDVSKVGTPLNNQLGIWTGDGTIEGDSDLTWNGSTFTASGTGSSDLVDLTQSGSGTTLNINNSGSGDFIVVDTNKMILDNAGNLSATNLTGTNTGDQTSVTGSSGNTDALNSATTTVNVSSSTAPTTGQVLTATSGTSATWQTPSGGGGLSWGDSISGSGESQTGITLTSVPFSQVGISVNNASIGDFEGSLISAGDGYDPNIAGEYSSIHIENEDNGFSTGYTSGIFVYNRSGDLKNAQSGSVSTDGTGAGIVVASGATNSTNFYSQSASANTKHFMGRAWDSLGSNQTVFTAELGTLASGHVGIQVNAKGASTAQRGAKFDFGTTGTGTAIEIVENAVGKNTESIRLNSTQSGTLSGRTSNLINNTSTRVNSGGGTFTDNYDAYRFYRLTNQGGAGTYTADGSVAVFQNQVAPVSGTLNDDVSVVELIQDVDSTGAHINFNTQSNGSAGTKDGDFWFDGTDLKIRAGGVTYTLTKS
jgi:hypothetical protein